MSTTVVQNLITAAIERANLVDQTGQTLRYTPHDFRRMFATEAVIGGLPVHIAARILGHSSLTTTQTYLAVFQDDLIRAYRAFVDQRRTTRPTGEYREPTDQEWAEFQQHFELRKLELGTCGRPYGTPCKHEHACFSELEFPLVMGVAPAAGRGMLPWAPSSTAAQLEIGPPTCWNQNGTAASRQRPCCRA